jgi:hypothetical protein
VGATAVRRLHPVMEIGKNSFFFENVQSINQTIFLSNHLFIYISILSYLFFNLILSYLIFSFLFYQSIKLSF